MKNSLRLLFIICLSICVIAPAPPPSRQNVQMAPNGDYYPLTFGGNPPNLPPGSRVGGVTIGSGGGGGGGSGSVTQVSVFTQNGISGIVDTATTTPVIKLTLGSITPISVNGIAFAGSGLSPSLFVTGPTVVSGVNSGDQTNILGNAATATILQVGRTINGVSFNGSANVTVPAAGSTLTDTVPVGKGGTGLTSLGTGLQVVRVNSGATALEYATVAVGSGDLLAANNLSDLVNAATARVNLDLAIGTNVEAWDLDLDYLSSFTLTANVKSLLNATDYAAVRTQLGLVVGTNVQPFSSNLSFYAAISPSVNVQTFLSSVDFAAMRSNLGLVIGTNVQAASTNLTSWAAIARAGGFDSFVTIPSSANQRQLLTDENGTGAALFSNATSPQFLVSQTTTSTTFSLYNTTATTIAAFGDATSVNIGANAALILKLGGAATSAKLRLLEPSGSGTNWFEFQAQAQTTNITYLMPPGLVAGGVLTDVAGNGNLIWAVPGAVDSEQTIANTNTAWASPNHVLRQTDALTASRSSALPLAVAYKKGERVLYIDKVTSASSAFARSFVASGSDTVNNGATYTPFSGPGTMELASDGVSNWLSIGDLSTLVNLRDPTDPTKVAQFDLSGIGTGQTRSLKLPNYDVPLGGRILVLAKGVTVLTTGTPADIATIALPTGVTRWRTTGTQASSATSVMVAETAAGTLAGATFVGFDSAVGAGVQILASATGPTAAGGITAFPAVNAISSGANIVIRQTANSANAGTISFYIDVQPLL